MMCCHVVMCCFSSFHNSCSVGLYFNLLNMYFTLSELGQLSGLAAILRFPIPDPEDDDDSSSEEDN